LADQMLERAVDAGVVLALICRVDGNICDAFASC
jgi:hypothetical protein